MRKIWKLLQQHWKQDFHAGQYGIILLFIAAGITINYTIRLENGIIDRDTGSPIRILWYFLVQSVAYWGACFIVLAFQKRLQLFRTPKFWWVSGVGLTIIAWNLGFPYLSAISRAISTDPALYVWLYKCASNATDFITSSLPLLVLAFFLKDSDRFGVNGHQVDLRPYWQLLMVIVPIIAIGSFEPGFKNYYPSYKTNTVAETLDWSAWAPPLIYETLYGMDFFNVELMYRGFLVIGMAKLLGKDAVLPMVCAYCALHFGKPVGEAISSVVGGYILGVVALYTRNIWGGVIVHVGLAWMMEVAAWLQKSI